MSSLKTAPFLTPARRPKGSNSFFLFPSFVSVPVQSAYDEDLVCIETILKYCTSYNHDTKLCGASADLSRCVKYAFIVAVKVTYIIFCLSQILSTCVLKDKYIYSLLLTSIIQFDAKNWFFLQKAVTYICTYRTMRHSVQTGENGSKISYAYTYFSKQDQVTFVETEMSWLGVGLRRVQAFGLRLLLN
jgi:hypothetical protein